MISFEAPAVFRLSQGQSLTSSNVSAWPRQTGYETISNRIAILRHDDGNRVSCVFGSTGDCLPTRNNHIDL